MEFAESNEAHQVNGPLGGALLVAATLAAGMYAVAAGLGTALAAGLNAATSRSAPASPLGAFALLPVGKKPVTPTDDRPGSSPYPLS